MDTKGTETDLDRFLACTDYMGIPYKRTSGVYRKKGSSKGKRHVTITVGSSTHFVFLEGKFTHIDDDTTGTVWYRSCKE